MTTTPAPIGGSEAAAACGLDPYRSQVRLYLEKRGEIEPREESEAMRWGTLLEPLIAEEVERRGYVCVPAPADAIVNGHMSGHPDGFVSSEGVDERSSPGSLSDASGTATRLVPAPSDGRGLLEIKTAGLYQSHSWMDGNVPPAYVIQCHHYMHLTGLEWALVAALIGGQRLELRIIERDPKLEAVMLELEAEFWRMLTEGQMPAPDGSSEATEAIKRLYPETSSGAVLTLTAEDMKDVRAYKALRESMTETERQADEIKQKLQLRMGDNELGLFDGSPVVCWSEVARKEYTVKAQTYRRFQVV